MDFLDPWTAYSWPNTAIVLFLVRGGVWERESVEINFTETMDEFLSEKHQTVVYDHFHEIDAKLKKLEHEAQAVEIPSNISGRSCKFISVVENNKIAWVRYLEISMIQLVCMMSI